MTAAVSIKDWDWKTGEDVKMLSTCTCHMRSLDLCWNICLEQHMSWINLISTNRFSADKALKHCITFRMHYQSGSQQYLEGKHPLCWRTFFFLGLWHWSVCQALCYLFERALFFPVSSFLSWMSVIYKALGWDRKWPLIQGSLTQCLGLLVHKLAVGQRGSKDNFV